MLWCQGVQNTGLTNHKQKLGLNRRFGVVLMMSSFNLLEVHTCDVKSLLGPAEVRTSSSSSSSSSHIRLLRSCQTQLKQNTNIKRREIKHVHHFHDLPLKPDGFSCTRPRFCYFGGLMPVHIFEDLHS